MKLLTKENLEQLPKLYTQEKLGDEAIAYVKFFDPTGSASWFITEGEQKEDDFLMFGYVTGLVEDELGYISLNELESVRGRFGLGIERDLHFKPTPLKELKQK